MSSEMEKHKKVTRSSLGRRLKRQSGADDPSGLCHQRGGKLSGNMRCTTAKNVGNILFKPRLA